MPSFKWEKDFGRDMLGKAVDNILLETVKVETCWFFWVGTKENFD